MSTAPADNVDWDDVYAIFERETEALEGGGVIVYGDKPPAPAPSHEGYDEEVCYAYLEDGEHMLLGNALHAMGTFSYQGYTYRLMEASNVVDADYLREVAEPILDSERGVFMGAVAISCQVPFDDDITTITADMRPCDQWEWETTNWAFVYKRV